MQHLAAKGWVCVAINYRLAPRDPFPAQIIDVKRAIAWIRDHIAEYGGDPDYIAITGGSAGGHLTALAAVTPNDPDYQPGFEDADTSVPVAVPHYGVYDFAGSTGLQSAELMRDHFLAPAGPQAAVGRRPRGVRGRHARCCGSPRTPPTSSCCTAPTTRLVGVDQARLFVARLREISGATVVYAELPGAQHAFDVFPSIRSAARRPRHRPLPALALEPVPPRTKRGLRLILAARRSIAARPSSLTFNDDDEASHVRRTCRLVLTSCDVRRRQPLNAMPRS